MTLTQALRRSHVLSRHATRFLLATVFLAEPVWLMAGIALQMIVDGGWTGDSSPGANAAGWLLSTLLLPPRMAVYVLLYGSRRRTQEAFDLEYALRDIDGREVR